VCGVYLYVCVCVVCACVVCICMCVVLCVCITLVFQHTNTRPVVCPVLPDISTLSHKINTFEKKVINHKMLVLIFSTNFV